MHDSVHCKVCGKRIGRNVVEPLFFDAYATVEYRGQTCYLCCPECQRVFEANPSEYVQEQSSSGDTS